jgi:RNA polymerase sigma-70 factor (ECF subfamily)
VIRRRSGNDPPAPAGFETVGAPAISTDQRQTAYTRYVIPEIEVLLRVALTMTPQPADAEDLVQDTLLRAWRSLHTFDGQHPRAWLLTILRNAEVNRHRRQRPELLDDPDLPVEHAGHGDGSHESAEDVVVRRAFDEVIDAALAALPDQFRQAVLLIDVDGLSYAEASNLLGVPEGTLMSRLHRARKRIRDRLAAADLAPHRRRL